MNIGVFFAVLFARKTKIIVKYKLDSVFVKKERNKRQAMKVVALQGTKRNP